MDYFDIACRAEGRCIKCKKLVHKRENAAEYRCTYCGGKDIRLPREPFWQIWLTKIKDWGKK